MHPHLPWDAGSLYLADLDAAGRPHKAPGTLPATRPDRHSSRGSPRTARCIFCSRRAPAIGAGTCTAGVTSAANWWRQCRRAELGLPPWQLGTSTWDFVDDRTVIAAAVTDGQTSLCQIDLGSGRVTTLPIALASVHHLAARAGRVVVHGGLTARPGGIFTFTLAPESAGRWGDASRRPPAT